MNAIVTWTNPPNARLAAERLALGLVVAMLSAPCDLGLGHERLGAPTISPSIPMMNSGSGAADRL